MILNSMNYIKSDIPSQFMIVIGVWPPLLYNAWSRWGQIRYVVVVVVRNIILWAQILRCNLAHTTYSYPNIWKHCPTYITSYSNMRIYPTCTLIIVNNTEYVTLIIVYIPTMNKRLLGYIPTINQLHLYQDIILHKLHTILLHIQVIAPNFRIKYYIHNQIPYY